MAPLFKEDWANLYEIEIEIEVVSGHWMNVSFAVVTIRLEVGTARGTWRWWEGAIFTSPHRLVAVVATASSQNQQSPCSFFHGLIKWGRGPTHTLAICSSWCHFDKMRWYDGKVGFRTTGIVSAPNRARVVLKWPPWNWELGRPFMSKGIYILQRP